MPGRSFVGANGFRYGYQGSEKDDEIKGNGNSYTTENRELDPRLGKWWTIDPKTKPWESPYASMANNPILYSDQQGADIDKKNLPKDEQKRITNMVNPKAEEYNKEFADAYKKLDEDHTAVYTFKYKGESSFENSENKQTTGQVTYGGENENKQDIINIEYTIGASSIYKANSALLEETFHADQFRSGDFGFAINTGVTLSTLSKQPKTSI